MMRLAAVAGLVMAVLPVRALCQMDPPSAGSPAAGDSPIPVRVAVFIIDLDEIDSAAQTFSANVYIEARWQDSSLAHSGKPLKRRVDEVWTPRLQLLNQQRIFSSFPETVEILPSGEVIYRQRFWGLFSQPLSLQAFPFDHQTLEIPVVAAGYRSQEVTILPLVLKGGAQSGIARKFSVADWDVERWEARPENVALVAGREGMPAMTFRIEVARKWVYFVAKVIVPLCLIVAVSWLVFWIDPENYGVTLSVAMTSVLTLIAYRFAVGLTLPRLSYLTRMDMFTLGATCLVFLTVLHVVCNHSLVRHQRKETAMRVNLWARLLYPAAFIAMALWALLVF